MKMYYGNTPINSLNIKHYEMDTNSATVKPSDLQAGVTCFGRGQKIIGTGKSFEFAQYGKIKTNIPIAIPNIINVISITSTDNPSQLLIGLNDMKDIDFSISQTISNIIIDSIEYPISVNINNGFMTLVCDQSIFVQVFYGKDNYV